MIDNEIDVWNRELCIHYCKGLGLSPEISSSARRQLKKWSTERITLRYVELAYRCDFRVYQLCPHLVCDYLVVRRQASLGVH